MRSTPVVALAALLACLPAWAVDVIDTGANAYLPTYLPVASLGPFLPSPVYFPSYAGALVSAYSFPYPFPFPPAPVSAHVSTYVPGGDRAGMPSTAALTDLALPAGAQASAAIVAEPMQVPEPVSVLMLACGLLLMVPGAWAARWSRLGDTDSLLQRRFP